MKSFYLIDIIEKDSLFQFSFGIRLPQNVIKTKAVQFKLLRIPVSSCWPSSEARPASSLRPGRRSERRLVLVPNNTELFHRRGGA